MEHMLNILFKNIFYGNAKSYHYLYRIEYLISFNNYFKTQTYKSNFIHHEFKASNFDVYYTSSYVPYEISYCLIINKAK